MSQTRQSAVRNRLLAALPPDGFAALAPALQPVELDFKQVLHRPDRPIEAGYFLEGGMVSMLAPLEEGQTTEVGIIGREGLVGLPPGHGRRERDHRGPGPDAATALRVPAAGLRDAFEASAALRAVVLRYAQASHAQVAQTAACNGQHAVDERLARWMLMAHDRAGADEFPMTQEFVAMMLGRAPRRRLGRGRHPAEGRGDPLRLRPRRGARPGRPGGGRVRVLRHRAAAYERLLGIPAGE